jgi:RimJ/RimL family protein N-acetyltransferase
LAPPVLRSANLTLRPAEPGDVERRLKLGAEPAENLRLYGVQPETVSPLTWERAENWVNALIEHPYAWVIEASSLLGAIRLDKVDFRDRRASLAIGLLQSELLGRGIGTEATRRVLLHAFSDLKLHRVSLRVLAQNKRAIRSYEKCGFRIEGRERETVMIDGAWQDHLIMGLLEHELRLDNA